MQHAGELIPVPFNCASLVVWLPLLVVVVCVVGVPLLSKKPEGAIVLGAKHNGADAEENPNGATVSAVVTAEVDPTKPKRGIEDSTDCVAEEGCIELGIVRAVNSNYVCVRREEENDKSNKHTMIDRN